MELHHPLQLIQQVERLQGGEGGDVELLQAHAQLVFRGLEQGELEGGLLEPALIALGQARGAMLELAVLQVAQDLLGPLDHISRHAGQAGNLDAVGVGGAAGDDGAQEYDLVVPLPHRHGEVPDPFPGHGQLGQFVVMGGEQSAGPATGGVVDVLGHGPGNGDAVEGGGAPADLVHHDQAFRTGVSQDVGRLHHLQHEGGLAPGQVVSRADPGEYPVGDADAGLAGRDEAAGLGHEADQGHLAHVGGFAGHVGAGNHQYLVFVAVQAGVVGDEALSKIHGLDDGMAAVLDVDDVRVVHTGACSSSAHRPPWPER